MTGARLHAANAVETLAFDAALKSFQGELWDRAEKEFADFVQKYPASEHYADAVVLESQALFQQKKYTAVIDLLAARQGHADKAADQFAYWTAESYFYSSNFQAAADAFGRLTRQYPASSRRLEAILGEAHARARLGDWPHVIDELRQPEAPFQQIARTNLANELVARGLLLLGEAQLAQEDYPGAKTTLLRLPMESLRPDLKWDWQYLLCRIELAGGHPEAALQASTNLLAWAAGRPDLRALSADFEGKILQESGRLTEAIKAYETDLSPDVPEKWQRQALLNVIELTLRQNQTKTAVQWLEDFLAKHPGAKDSDLELLTLGELYLKEHYADKEAAVSPGGGGTNFLQQAQDEFARILNAFTNSEYAGKAGLNLGWCLWEGGKFVDSQTAFSNALQRLPFSEDQAVARFKLGDIDYLQKNLPGAITNYEYIIRHFGSFAAVKNDLFEPALYQILRANLEQTNLPAATEAMKKILEWFPGGLLGDRSMLLVGEGWSRRQNPAMARGVFSDFIARLPHSPLLPEVKLALARTYERETNWPAALANYEAWVAVYTNSPSLPRAAFSLAWASYEAGLETNAFTLFTNFVARFPTNELAGQAQYWVADSYWKREDFQRAESIYQDVFTRWTNSEMAFPARMMAGRAAMARDGYSDAITYFTNLTSNPQCPPGLQAQALFACGDALMASASTTNFSPCAEAMTYFNLIAKTYTNSVIAPLAWGRLGDCYLLLAANDRSQYELAENAYQTVMGSPLAGISPRSMAECGLAGALENIARLNPATNQIPSLKLALDHYLNVVYGANRRAGEKPDSFWVKEAGLAAGRLEEELGEWKQAMKLYEHLQQDLPPLQLTLGKKIEKARENLALEKN